MVEPRVGDLLPTAMPQDLEGDAVEFPSVFSDTPTTVVFSYRGRW